jgi:hypothetical protein
MGDGGIKAYQIYYDESQKDSLMDGFISHFNEKATVNLESGIICDLVNQGECSNCDWFGVFSWKVRDKIKGFDFERLNDVTAKSGEYDVLAANPRNCMPEILPTGPYNIRELHVEIWPPMDMLLRKLQQASIIPTKKRGYMWKKKNYIYCNFFLAKKDIYLDYVESLLKPAIDLFQTDGELNKLGMKAPNTQYDNPPQRFVDHTGLTQYPHIPFVLERLINVYVEAKSIKVGYAL